MGEVVVLSATFDLNPTRHNNGGETPRALPPPTSNNHRRDFASARPPRPIGHDLRLDSLLTPPRGTNP